MNRKWFAYSAEYEGSDLNMLLYPYAGAGASMFVPWKKALSAAADFLPVQYPFRETRRSEPHPESAAALGKAIAAENPDIFSERYAIFGHCAGAAIAYETVCEANRLYGTDPVFFAASGAEPPEYKLRSMERMFQAAESDFLDYLIQNGFIAEQAAENTAFLEYYLPLIRADFQMMAQYQPSEQHVMHCPIYLFTGKDDMVIEQKHLAGWQVYTDQSVQQIWFEGGHYYFHASVQAAAAQLDQIIAAHQKGGTPYA